MPFLTVADHYLGGAAVLAWIAGIVSVLAALVAGSRLPGPHALRRRPVRAAAGALGRLRPKSETPVNALLTMAVVGLGIIGVWWVSCLSAATPDR